VQAVQYLLGNGATFENDDTKERLGKDFDARLQQLATYAKNCGASFGFFNNGRLDVFSILEFVPLKDEEDGAIKAGIRFWQIDDSKPLRAVLYELDGYTSYVKRKDKDIAILRDKQTYRQNVRRTELLGEEILGGDNYPGFPVVPLYNINGQSDLCGNRGTIDAYDLLSSKFVNNVSEGDLIYWIIKNADGMDDMDDMQFLDRLRTVRVAHAGGGGAEVDAHTVETPYESNEAVLARLEKQLYHDFMALNTDAIQAGNVTATQIQAAYEPLNQKTDLFEYQIRDFIGGILEIAGIEDEVSFTRSQMSNQAELTQMVMTASADLGPELTLKKLPFLTPEEVKARLEEMAAEDTARMTDFEETEEIPPAEEE